MRLVGQFRADQVRKQGKVRLVGDDPFDLGYFCCKTFKDGGHSDGLASPVNPKLLAENVLTMQPANSRSHAEKCFI